MDHTGIHPASFKYSIIILILMMAAMDTISLLLAVCSAMSFIVHLNITMTMKHIYSYKTSSPHNMLSNAGFAFKFMDFLRINRILLCWQAVFC